MSTINSQDNETMGNDSTSRYLLPQSQKVVQQSEISCEKAQERLIDTMPTQCWPQTFASIINAEKRNRGKMEQHKRKVLNIYGHNIE